MSKCVFFNFFFFRDLERQLLKTNMQLYPTEMNSLYATKLFTRPLGM